MTPHAETTPKRVIVLGSTGSIGVNVLRVIEHLNSLTHHKFEVVGLAAGSNAEALAGQAQRLNVNDIAIADESSAEGLSSRKPAGHERGVSGDSAGAARQWNVRAGADAAERLVKEVPADLVVAAMVGFAGLPAVLAAIENRSDIALANKETLVAAGELVMSRARGRNVRIIPIDSEHSAVMQLLVRSRRSEGPIEPHVGDVHRIVLTASGGPFRDWPLERMKNATVDEALNHPTWSMGPKITIDSATMMNKTLEVIEANWLFGLPAHKIDVVIHPQSTVHAFVEFDDCSVLAQLAPPDMKGPIQYALTMPDRARGCAPRLDWRALRQLDFQKPDHERFPALALARRVIETGGSAGAILNAANEVAVQAFLERRIAFGRIVELVIEALDHIDVTPIGSIDDVLRADSEARQFTSERIVA